MVPITVRKPVASAIAACLAIAPLTALAQVPLTLTDALAIAESRAPALRAAASAAQAARDMGQASGQLPDPVLRAGVDNLPINGADRFSLTNDFMTMRRIGVMQEYVSRQKRALREERGEREAKREALQGRMARAEMRAEVSGIWADRLYAVRSERLAETLLSELAMQRRATEAQVVSGKASAADVLAVDAMVAMARDRALAARAQQQLARARLARWLGQDAARPLSEELSPAPEEEIMGGVDDAALRSLPALRALRAATEIAQTEVAIAEQNRSPNWSWEFAYQQRGAAYSNMVSLGVSIPLPVARDRRQDRELAAKRSLVQQSREIAEDAERRVAAEFRALRVEWNSLHARRRELEATLVPAAQARVEAALAAYGGGQQMLTMVLDARRAELDARLQLLELERDAAKLGAQLIYSYVDPQAQAGQEEK